MNSVEIFRAALEDIPSISAVQKEAWLATYPNEDSGITIEDILSEDFYSEERIGGRTKIISDPDSKTRFFVAKSEGRVIGYCCAQKLDDCNKIRALYIVPAFQGAGVGSKLMKEAFDFLDENKATKLTVAIYNAKAISFYKKLGFIEGERVASNPEGAFMSGREMPEMEMIKKALI